MPDQSINLDNEKSTDATESRLRNRDKTLIQSAVLSETPSFPKSVLVEVANICNHACTFCPYPLTTRRGKLIDPEFLKRALKEAYDLGAREAGLYGGAEPFTCKKLDLHVRNAKEVGYDYVYVSTNGSLPSKERLKTVIDAGVDSLKFSVNGGNRETYALVHGQDHFDKVVENIEFVLEHRKTLDRKMFVYISFVQVPKNADSLPELIERFEGRIDEFYINPAVNVSGQMPNLPLDENMPDTCVIPFNQLNITAEGHLRVCCNDYQNSLAIEDLNKMSVGDAFYGDRFRDFRRRHMNDDLKGTLCHNCLKGCFEKVHPLNPELGDWGPLNQSKLRII
ncbi:radical SAM protein [Hwanghaeella grinnelliae]|uniref:Radical SAM protein n=1 Tax=Hwanghaeella grinnelliae TaxID=2500179 RepID=A0A3S2W578_9PROT|nr:radical SAM/SPASM domain-containing protein [Hwanghaeella grinnelliae]RVU36770.1 radical SAM protein [Hwanghaeella grinnelliae]